MPDFLYPSSQVDAANGNLDFDTNDIKVMLVASGYTPSASHTKRSDITNEVTGTGYTSGGISLSSKTYGTTAANSWTVQRANNTAYNVGDIVRPATGNGFVYVCAVAGTSGGSPPTFSTVKNRETADGTVVWCTAGSSVVAFDAADPTFTSVTLSGVRGAVYYRSRGGLASADELVAYQDFVTDRSSGGGDFTIVLNGAGIFAIAI